MILSRFSFPSPPSALCTVFGERGLPCRVTLLGSSLSPCPKGGGGVHANSGGGMRGRGWPSSLPLASKKFWRCRCRKFCSSCITIDEMPFWILLWMVGVISWWGSWQALDSCWWALDGCCYYPAGFELLQSSLPPWLHPPIATSAAEPESATMWTQPVGQHCMAPHGFSPLGDPHGETRGLHAQSIPMFGQALAMHAQCQQKLLYSPIYSSSAVLFN